MSSKTSKSKRIQKECKKGNLQESRRKTKGLLKGATEKTKGKLNGSSRNAKGLLKNAYCFFVRDLLLLNGV